MPLLSFALHIVLLFVWTLIALRVAWVMHRAAFAVVLSDAWLNGYPLSEHVWLLGGVRVVNAAFVALVWGMGVAGLDWLFSSVPVPR